MITARSNQVRAISTKCTVPHPALMALQARFQRKRPRWTVRRKIFISFEVVGLVGIDAPDAGVVVRAAGGEVADVGAKEDAGHVGSVRLEGSDGGEGGLVAVLLHAPDVDVALEGWD